MRPSKQLLNCRAKKSKQERCKNTMESLEKLQYLMIILSGSVTMSNPFHILHSHSIHCCWCILNVHKNRQLWILIRHNWNKHTYSWEVTVILMNWWSKYILSTVFKISVQFSVNKSQFGKWPFLTFCTAAFVFPWSQSCEIVLAVARCCSSLSSHRVGAYPINASQPRCELWLWLVLLAS